MLLRGKWFSHTLSLYVKYNILYKTSAAVTLLENVKISPVYLLFTVFELCFCDCA